MINNISAYQGTPPVKWDNDEDRLIEGGPLYEIADLVTALERKLVIPNTDCNADFVRMGITRHQDQVEFVKMGLTKGQYEKSYWCKTGSFKNCAAACDSYTFTRHEWSEALGKEMAWKYYLKLAINKSGKAVLLISCHD